MELKPGRQQTVLGDVPADWNITTVAGIASRARNAIVGGPFGSDLVSRDYVEQGVPVIRGQNMGGQWISGQFVFVTPSKAKSLEANLAHSGDLVFTQRGTLGQVSLVPEKPFHAYLVSQSQMKLSVNLAVADPLFIFYVFASDIHQDLIRASAIQTGVPHINLGILRDTPLQLPPLFEQHSIAEGLSAADAHVVSLEQLLAKKRLIKQGAMQQLLAGTRRLPGFEEKWNMKPLGELFTFSGGYSASRDQLSAEGHLYLHYGDIHAATSPFVNAQVNADQIPRLDIPLRDIASRSLLSDGDVVFVDASEDDDGASKHVVVVNPEARPFISGLHTIVAKAKSSALVREYQGYCFQTAAVKDQFRFFAVGTKVTGISKTNIAKVVLPVPPVDEQAAIASILVEIDDELRALEVKLAKARLIKEGMMQNLLTGKIRLV